MLCDVKYVVEVPDSFNARLEARAKLEHVTPRALLVWLIKGDLSDKTGHEEGSSAQTPEPAVA